MASSWSFTGTITRPTCVIWGIVLSFRTVRGYDRRMGENSSPARSPPATVRFSAAFHERNRLAFTSAIPPKRHLGPHRLGDPTFVGTAPRVRPGWVRSLLLVGSL